jgi:hypothetical protein
VVFLAVPPAGIAALAGRLPAGPVVVDPTNYVPGLRDEPVAALEAGGVESRHTEAVVGHPVIKAFNTVNAAQLAGGARPAGAADRIAVPVAGDDERGKRIVVELAGQIGFDGFDAGPLDESWRQQPGTPIYTTGLPSAAAVGALAAADPAQTLAWRTRMARPHHPAPTDSDQPAASEMDRSAAAGSGRTAAGSDRGPAAGRPDQSAVGSDRGPAAGRSDQSATAK